MSTASCFPQIAAYFDRNLIELLPLDKTGLREKETVMNIVTSWTEQGIAQAEEQSRAREAALLVRLLRRNIGAVSAATEQAIRQLSFEQFEQLGDALFDFASEADLLTWLSLVN